MKPGTMTAQNEKGMALPLALFALVGLSMLALAFLSMAATEPQISTNLADAARARYVAESGIEWALDQVALNPNWSALLVGPDGNQNTPDDQLPSYALNLTTAAMLTPLNNPLPIPGQAVNNGTFSVTIRNDNIDPQAGYAGDRTLTGFQVAGAPAEDPGGKFTDTNGILIVTSTGTVNGASRTIQVVISRLTLPPFPGAYSMPGLQADLWFNNCNSVGGVCTSFNIDGRDYRCTANCSNSDFAQRTYGLNTDQSKMKFGIAVQPGVQENLGSPSSTTYEQRIEAALNSSSKRSAVSGKNQTNPSSSTTGLNTVAYPADPLERLTPSVMQNFLTAVAQFSGTTVLQSTMSCPMVLTGNTSGAYTSTPQLTNGCSINQTLDLGTRQSPKLIYFRGDPDPTSAFPSLRLRNNIQGAGILVVEDGDLRTLGNFRWDGIVVVTGQYVSSIFESGSNTTVYGATVANETVWNEGGNQDQTTYWDGWFEATSVNLRASQEALDLVQRKLLVRVSAWREL